MGSCAGRRNDFQGSILKERGCCLPILAIASREVTMRLTRTIRSALFIALLLALAAIALLEGWRAQPVGEPTLRADPVCTHGYAPYGCYPVPARGGDLGWLERL
ncbi:hypothetical protein HBN97_12420 [Pseudomonas oryzihabitans]|nr:hypothetical protein [Pseudomonas psychrotolerans]NMZ45701.1 hypothetical protein [Pseudomonas oryzihabitans]